ncbi:hypothetical protein ABT213_28355 [Streptomyces sp. NPDC001674]|uniref:hypothetical protein n=1 Tax=Streptomyces sp. NPDC001674 TaxID=3154394 RepID=UPI00332C2A7F
MSTATLTTPVQGGRPRGATATATATAATASVSASDRPRHRVGGVLRAVKVFAAAAVSVAVLGEYSADAGVIRR